MADKRINKKGVIKSLNRIKKIASWQVHRLNDKKVARKYAVLREVLEDMKGYIEDINWEVNHGR